MNGHELILRFLAWATLWVVRPGTLVQTWWCGKVMHPGLELMGNMHDGDILQTVGRNSGLRREVKVQI